MNVQALNITILGSGNMGGAMAKGLIRSGATTAQHLTVTRNHPETPAELAALGITTTQDNAAAVSTADLVLVALKPWAISEVLRSLVKSFRPDATVISLAAGVTLENLDADLGRAKTLRIVRAMPNTAVCVKAGVTALASDSEEGLELAKELFSAVGLAVVLPEKQFDVMTALSGCGIAHALRFLRAGMSAGLEMGIPASLAGEIFAQVMKGAAELVLHSGNHPEVEVDRVCTPGGLTIRGLNEMERHAFTSAVIQGLLASLPKK
ncbi:MAG: pyrroline-5-carboxylate reductase [Kiritimatiellia bacterium]